MALDDPPPRPQLPPSSAEPPRTPEAAWERPVRWVMRLFSDVRPGETAAVLLLFFNLFLVLAAYYVLKTAREGLILATGGAEAKSYASAVQAVLLIGVVLFYGWLGKRVRRLSLILGLGGLYVVCIELAALGSAVRLPGLGFAFFVFVGIFSVSIIAQFWSYANDLVTREMGERLFPVIAIGATLGAPLGSAIAAWLSGRGVGVMTLLQLPALALGVHLLLYVAIERIWRRDGADAAALTQDQGEPDRVQGEGEARGLGSGNGFAMVLSSPYLRLVALLLILLNLVNTTGEYVLGKGVLVLAQEAVARGEIAGTDEAIGAWIGEFYGWFFTIVNIAAVAIQALLVSRIVKYLGMAGALFALPVIALGVYGLAAVGVAFSIFAYAKMAENSTDYSLMNTTRAMLWLTTTREEKYVAKQTIDTFMVRLGDVLSALLVWFGSAVLALGPRAFAGVNVVLVALWLAVSWLVLREYRRLEAAGAGAGGPVPEGA